MIMNKKLLMLLILFVASNYVSAQKERKVNFIGGARSVNNGNILTVNDSIADSTTVKKNNGGYTLIDLGLNIKPNKNTEILGMFRIRNEYGGFWGAGVNFDVRQLWIKGVVANTLRYQLGDLDLKQTQFTLYNAHADRIDSLPTIFNLQNDIVKYERFYFDRNTWRMQGANVDFGFTFAKYISEINFNAFVARVNATDFANTPDRLMAGLKVNLVGNKIFQLSYNGNSVFDVKGTVANNNVFKNSVNSLDLKLQKNIGKQNLLVQAEAGKSKYFYSNDTLAPTYDDYFIHAFALFDLPKMHLQITAGYLNVGPDFRSIGAQSKDVNYNAQPAYFNRYTNAQQIRPLALFDIISNENIYNRTITARQMSESQIYNNVLPFGLATFNRIGMYAKVEYKSKKEISINAEYYNLSEIRGQGSLALKQFSIYKMNANFPINKLINSTKVLSVQIGGNMQQTIRSSEQEIEKIDLQSMQLSAGLRWEFASNFELLGGYISQENDGNEYKADRNSYDVITYFNPVNYKIKQQIVAGGLRYNFTSKIYLCGLYQQSTFTDKLKTTADFGINQFGLIFNMTF